MRILSLNAGSSTLKYGLFEDDLTELKRGTIENAGRHVGGLAEQLDGVFGLVGEVGAIGVRVVHGGGKFLEATRVSPEVIAQVRELTELAPLHNGPDADLLEALHKRAPSLPVVAVFDTAFHRTLPPVATTYALPRELAERLGIRRYGFHGISYRYVVDRLQERLGRQLGKFVICHLGSGASVCAIRDGVSVETSMGFTPLEGLVMGTRSGDLDPAIVEYLVRKGPMTAAEVEALLNHDSGLKGVSGTSSDVRTLEQLAATGDKQAEFALDLFSYRIAKYVGAYSVVLGGLDGLVFCGGIGEHSSEMRSRICARLTVLGAPTPCDPDGDISCISGDSPTQVWVVQTDEELQIARETKELLG
jgi:acetate kinase